MSSPEGRHDVAVVIDDTTEANSGAASDGGAPGLTDPARPASSMPALPAASSPSAAPPGQ
jgi:hypothetical protein